MKRFSSDTDYILEPAFVRRLTNNDITAWQSAFMTLYPGVFTPKEFVSLFRDRQVVIPSVRRESTHPARLLSALDVFNPLTEGVSSGQLELHDFITRIVIHREDLPHQRGL